MTLRSFVDKNYKHFNAAVVRDAAIGWETLLKDSGKMFLAMGGAMSTAELGISLAQMIREDKVHAISTTGANLEEDIFRLVAFDDYDRLSNYRNLTAHDETMLRQSGLNRVTDTCIPEEKAMRKIEAKLITLWRKAEAEGANYFPHEFIFQLFENKLLTSSDFQADIKTSWVYAAYQKKIPLYIPGWEDSTLGNFFVANKLKGHFESLGIVRHGTEQMVALIDWYLKTTKLNKVGFFQIGGGIAGDFPVCVVPLINQDLKKKVPFWSYYAQISDSTTSYGGYSGAVPNEKITWGKIEEKTPRFIIESDATIVAPLIFQYVLESSSQPR